MKSFKAPKTALGPLDAEATAALVAAASDVAIVLDGSGVIRDVAFSADKLSAELACGERWIGRPWIETVARDSRPKVEEMLRGAPEAEQPRWRHLNQVGPGGVSIPLLYAAFPLGRQGRQVVFGRDLRPLSQLQQRLVEVQQSVERGYAQLRQAETRYRLLFQTAEDAVLIVDGDSGKLAEANPAALRLLGNAARRLLGRPVADAFAPASREAIHAMLAALRNLGRVEEFAATIAGAAAPLRVAATAFRQEDGLICLLRLSPPAGAAAVDSLAGSRRMLLRAAESAPDGLLVTDEKGAILTANAAFLDMAQLPAEEQLRGATLEGFLGRQGLEAEVLLSNLRSRGAVRHYATTLRGALGVALEVEISAVTVMDAGERRFGIAIRDVGARLRPSVATTSIHGRTAQELTDLIGKVPLKDLVREAADAIERLCIEAALEVTRDNRASAAEMLGLSRQSLYAKLHRYGLGDLDAEARDPS